MRKRADQQKYRMEKVKCRKKNQQTVFLKLVGKEGRVCAVTSSKNTYLKPKNNNSNTQVPRSEVEDTHAAAFDDCYN